MNAKKTDERNSLSIRNGFKIFLFTVTENKCIDRLTIYLFVYVSTKKKNKLYNNNNNSRYIYKTETVSFHLINLLLIWRKKASKKSFKNLTPSSMCVCFRCQVKLDVYYFTMLHSSLDFSVNVLFCHISA